LIEREQNGRLLGIGAKGKGRNMLGVLLMQLRDEFALCLMNAFIIKHSCRSSPITRVLEKSRNVIHLEVARA